MKKTLYFLICFAFLLLWSSCRKDFDFSPSSGNLGFSKDTVYLDTVFTNIGSSTYNLKVYNRSDDDINIPSVKLALGEDSEYRLNVDGIAGISFENVEILAKDSMYIFIETTIDIDNLPDLNNEFLYTDKIEFDSGSNIQDVDLVTLVKDAYFILLIEVVLMMALWTMNGSDAVLQSRGVEHYQPVGSFVISGELTHFFEAFSPSIKNGSVASLVLNCSGLNEKSSIAFTDANLPAPAARI